MQTAQADVIPPDLLMTPEEVSGLFRIDPATLARWARNGDIPSVKLPGGHRRYRRADVEAILAGVAPESEKTP